MQTEQHPEKFDEPAPSPKPFWVLFFLVLAGIVSLIVWVNLRGL